MQTITKNRSWRMGKKRLLTIMITLFMSIAAIGLARNTTHASLADGIVSQINSFIHGGSGTINAELDLDNETIVHVTGTVNDAKNTLELIIGEGVTVKWKASFTGSINNYGTLISCSGDGTFEVAEGGLISNTGSTGRAINHPNDTTIPHINVTGGSVSAASGDAIHTAWGAVITVSGGTVSSSTTAISADGASSKINITGGIVSTQTNNGIYAAGMVTVSGGTILATKTSGTGIKGVGSSFNCSITGGTFNVADANKTITFNAGNVYYGGGSNIIDGGITRTAGTTGTISGYYVGDNSSKFKSSAFSLSNLFKLDTVIFTRGGFSYNYNENDPVYYDVTAILSSDKLTVTGISAHGTDGTIEGPVDISAKAFTFTKPIKDSGIALDVTAIINGTPLSIAFTSDEFGVYLTGAPRIIGQSEMTLYNGYSAASTTTYSFYGQVPVVVTKTSGDPKITWNDTTKKLEVETGLAVGKYTVTLKASNGTLPDHSFTFTLTVKDAPVFNLTTAKWQDGTAPGTSATNLDKYNCWMNSTHLYVTNGASIVITGTSVGGRSIRVTGNAAITLSNVNMSSTNDSPIFLNSGARLTLTLDGSNTITAGTTYTGYAAIQTSNATLIIEGTGSLTAKGAGSGAGIGGGGSGHTGNIIINSGTIIASSDKSASFAGAGIGSGGGGGSTNLGGTVTINGGTVTANGAGYSAGIGNGSGCVDGGVITINGGIVTANGAGKGAGIGGVGNYVGTLVMNGNAVVYASSVSSNITKKQGILFAGKTGTFYGNTTLQNDFVVDGGYILTAYEGSCLTVPFGITLTNNGTITLKNEDNVAVAGTFNGNKMQLHFTIEPFHVIYAPGLTLGSLALPARFTWDDGSSTLLYAENNQQYGATYNSTNGYFTSVGKVTINVAQAEQNNFFIVPLSETVTEADEPFNLTTEGGSGAGEIIFSLLYGNGTVTHDGIVTIMGAGDIVIIASKAGDRNYKSVTSQIIIRVNSTAVAPTITGDEEKNLDYGYSATCTNTYTITGDTPVTITTINGDEKITWNDTTKKIDIASGLSAGKYIVTLKASNSVSPDYIFTFTLTVNAATVTAPSFGGGQLTMTLTEGYTATATDEFMITGSGIVTVVKLNGDAKISWNNTNKTLDIAIGLIPGTYVVTLKASNGTYPDALHTFTLTVNAATPSVPLISTASLVGGIVGTAYSQSLVATGSNLIWSIQSGKLPDGLTMLADGTISGTPLMVGTFTFTVNATNANGSDSKALSITVTNNTVASTAPSIIGDMTMTLDLGYIATSTDAYVISGDAPVIVTKLNGNSLITWNNTTKKLDIAAGLIAGTYFVTIKASNGLYPDALYTFTLIVTGGSVETPHNGLSTGAVVGITIGATVAVFAGVFSVIWFVIKKKKFADLGKIFKKD